MKKRLILNASNIRSSGGKVLLRQIVENVPDYCDVIFLINKELKDEFRSLKNAFYFGSSFVERIKSELFLKKISQKKDWLLCFGNLPPLFTSKAKVFVFFHNLAMIQRFSLFEIYFFFATKKFNFIVQSKSVKERLISSNLYNNKIIYIFPFFKMPNRLLNSEKEALNKGHIFIYPANGEEHKNHNQLLDGWTLLSKEKIFPKLILTISNEEYPALFKRIEHLKSLHKLVIENLGSAPHSLVLENLEQSSALIYPSLFESLGIPLLEAKQINLPIISSELDYVRDLVVPCESFDPNSALSISRAVKRFMKIKSADQEIGSPDDLIKFILSI